MVLIGTTLLPLAAHAEDPETTTVEVKAKKPDVVKKVDRTVYNVADMPRATNGTAQDVLQSTPEVSVSGDGQIAVKGNSNVTVLVDGKPTAMLSGSEQAIALQTMSGADIASVEVITNPSASFNANGGAILNIVLKRNRKPGAHGQIQGSTSDQHLWNVGSSGDMTRQDISVHGSLAYRHDGTLKFRESTVDWNNPLGSPSLQTRQTSEVFVRREVKSGALGVDYAISDVDSLGFSGRYNERHSRPLFDVLNVNRTGSEETIFHRVSEGPNEQSDASANLSFSHQGRETAFKAAIQHSDTVALIDKSYRDVFVQPVSASDYSRGATRSERHLDQATLDWTLATASSQWGAGLDIQEKVDNIDNYQATIDPSTGAETPAPDTTNSYNVKTSTAAAYLTYLIKHGSWETLLGGRAERVALRLRSAQYHRPENHWQAFNPSMNLRYTLSDAAELTASYRRSLQMPDPRDLNPHTTYIDAQNLSRGNPGLQPQHLTSWEVGASLDARQVSGSVGLFYRTSTDTVIDARSFGTDNVLVTSKDNGGRARSGGVTGSLDWKLDSKLKVGGDVGIYRVMLDTPDLAALVRESGTAAYLNVRASYSAGNDDVSLDAHCQSAGVTPLGRFGATSNVNLTWKRQLSKTWSLTVNANDIFDGSKRTYSTTASTYHQAGFDHFVARRVYIGVVKKFE